MNALMTSMNIDDVASRLAAASSAIRTTTGPTWTNYIKLLPFGEEVDVKVGEDVVQIAWAYGKTNDLIPEDAEFVVDPERFHVGWHGSAQDASGQIIKDVPRIKRTVRWDHVTGEFLARPPTDVDELKHGTRKWSRLYSLDMVCKSSPNVEMVGKPFHLDDHRALSEGYTEVIQALVGRFREAAAAKQSGDDATFEALASQMFPVVRLSATIGLKIPKRSGRYNQGIVNFAGWSSNVVVMDDEPETEEPAAGALDTVMNRRRKRK